MIVAPTPGLKDVPFYGFAPLAWLRPRLRALQYDRAGRVESLLP
jgi:hypothetical protein